MLTLLTQGAPAARPYELNHNSQMLVSAIILNYRTPHDTVACVDSLLRQTIADQIEIIIVDNHSEDKSIDLLRNLLGQGRQISILKTERNIGFAKGNNFGAANAAGEHILIINPDTTIEPDALEKMVSYLRENQNVGIIGPQLVFPDGTIRDSYRTFPTITDIIIKRTPLKFFFPKRMKTYLQWGKSAYEVRDVDWLVGACLFMRKDLLDHLGGFDPRFFLFFEDTDLCKRCRETGKRVVYFPDAKGKDNQHRLSEGGIFSFVWKKTVRIHIVSAVKYFWKW